MHYLSSLAAALRRDTLLRRLLLLYAAAVVAVAVVGAAVISFAVWPHYEQLERRESEHRLHAVLQAVQSEKDRLQELANTNAVWDDAFEFANERNPEFPEINYSTDALEQIGVDAVLVVRNDGHALYGGGRGEFGPLLTATQRALAIAPSMQLRPQQESETALLIVGSDVALISQRRIVRADGSGPSPGVLLFARRISPELLARMRTLTGTDFLIGPGAHDAAAEDARARTGIADAYGREAIQIAVLGEHDVLAVGQNTIITLAAAAAVMLALLAAAFAAALIGAVIAPVSSLRRAVMAASEKQAPCQAPAGAPQEIKELAAAFDAALHTAQAQMELRNAALAEKQLAVRANEAKSTFIANISHELRTPLNAIIGYGELMSEEAAEDGRPQDAEDAIRIVRAAQGLLALINAILDFSKLGAGRMVAVAEEFEVQGMLRSVTDIVAPLAAAKAITLDLKIAPELGRMSSDPQKLQQCLINLMSNAVKFTDKGAVTLRAMRGTKDGAAFIQFEVTDTGIGIEADALKRIFEPFSQADSSISGRFGGTGLGLAITRDLVRLMGGRIAVKSKAGVGTTFVIRAPVAMPAQAAPAEIRDAA